VIDRTVVKKRRRKVEERYEHHAFKQSRLLRKMAQFNLSHQNLGSHDSTVPLPPLIWRYRYEQATLQLNFVGFASANLLEEFFVLVKR
jgi:hypothetical protein